MVYNFITFVQIESIMKKLFLIITVLFAASCSKDEIKTKGKLDSNALISIRPAVGVKSGDLTAKEIVKKTTSINFWNNLYNVDLNRGFADSQRDTVNVRLLMWGTDIIDQEGKYVPDFIEGRNILLRSVVRNQANTAWIIDTLAYIPNSVLLEAKGKIQTAFADSNFVEVYRLFDQAFRFTPISGAQWRALKVQGLQ